MAVSELHTWEESISCHFDVLLVLHATLVAIIIRHPENNYEVPERAGLQRARQILLVLRHSKVGSAQVLGIPEHCHPGARRLPV